MKLYNRKEFLTPSLLLEEVDLFDEPLGSIRKTTSGDPQNRIIVVIEM